MNTRTLITIAMTPVESSQIAAIGYDAATHTLQVDFTKNPDRIYQYHDVSAEAFAGLEGAESKGSFFYGHVKDKVAYTRFDRATGDVQKTWAPETEGSEQGTDAKQAA